MHLANFALPEQRGDFGSGAVDVMRSGDVLVVLFEYGPESIGQALFRRRGVPRNLRPDMFSGSALQRTVPGQAGTQIFFTEADRAFCLYVVLGKHQRGDPARTPGQPHPARHEDLAPMTLAFRRRAATTEVVVDGAPPADAATAADSLAHEGVHRDTSIDDPIAGATLSQRVVRAASSVLSARPARRSFLTKTAVVGSALAVDPLDFVLRPGTAYGYVCGTCSDGWTAFCCTINSGRNSCPSGSFVAGWWKADNAAYCCGAARYIIDCNATCPTQCSCRCSGASCDGRRTCCNQFRYGQCHQEISCYGPVVCRVATCTPPWRYDPRAPPRARPTTHGEPRRAVSRRLQRPSPTASAAALGHRLAVRRARRGRGFLGAIVRSERAVSDRRGRYAVYRHGRIYWTRTTGANEVHGSILSLFSRLGGVHGFLGYPTSDTRTSADGRSRYSNFEGGRIYYWSRGTFEIHGAILLKHEGEDGVSGYLGYPTSSTLTSSDGRSRYSNFEGGRIYYRNGALAEIHGAIFRKHEALRGAHGLLGYPESDVLDVGDRRGRVTIFEHGQIFFTPTTGAFEIHGAIWDRYHRNGGPRGYLRYPTSDVRAISDGIGKYSQFERGRIYWTPRTGAFEVHGAVLDKLFAVGDVTGNIGYPTSELVPVGSLRRQNFEHGRLTYNPVTGRVTLG